MSVSVYLCLHLPEFPAQSAIRLRPELQDAAVAILENDPPLERICSLNAAAASAGLCSGMTRLQAEQFTAAKLLRRSLQEENTSRQAAWECAARFSPRIEEVKSSIACTLFLDITGTERLFGAPELLAPRLQRELRKVRLHASIAVSRNLESAGLLARSLTGITIVTHGLDNRFLAPLPVEALPLSPEQGETLSMWGIRRLGELAALPEKALIARMGQSAKRLRRLARGEAEHLFVPSEASEDLQEHIEFDSGIELAESLLFVLSSMLEQLALRAEARALSIAALDIALRLDDRSVGSRTVCPSLPSLDVQMFLRLVHLDLIAHPPTAPIMTMTVTAALSKPNRTQLGLFSPQLPEATRLDVTLARISALVGEGNVGSPQLEDTHRPDSFHVEPFQPRPAQQAFHGQPRLALRRLRPMEAIRVDLKDRRPEIFYFRAECFHVTGCYGPWKCSGDWWNGPQPEGFAFESWDVIAKKQQHASSLFCLILNDKNGAWWMAGLYD